MPKILELLIQTISPLHLGSDEVFEPFNSVFREDKKCLVAFDPYDFLDRLPPQELQNFNTICRRGTVGSLLEIYKFMHRHRELATGLKVAVPQALLERYKQVLSMREQEFSEQINRFIIKRTAYLPVDQRPYLPGTAVKGAWRTAYLNFLASQQQPNLPEEKMTDGRYLEQQLLGGSFHTDPFRLVKVSDFLPVGQVKTRIVYAVNLKKGGGQGHGPYQILEVIEPGAWFRGTVVVEDWPSELKNIALSLRADISRPIKADGLLQSVMEFYLEQKNREEQELFSLGLPSLKWPADNGFLPCRIGLHSGAECLTIAGYRKIKIKTSQQDYEIDDQTTTLWLAAPAPQNWPTHSLQPFGWVVLQEITPELEAQIRQRQEDWQIAKAQKAAEAAPKVQIPELEGSGAPSGGDLQPPPAAEEVVWDQAILNYNRGKQELMARRGEDKATAKGLDLVPAALRTKIDKKGLATAKVTVEKYGNAWKIIKVEESG